MKKIVLGVLAVLAFIAAGCSEKKDGFGGASVRESLSVEKVWTRLYSNSPEKLRGALVREGVDVTGSHHRLRFVDVYANRAELARIQVQHSDRIEGTEGLSLRKSTAALSQYRDPSEVSAFLDQVQADHPNLAQKVDLSGPLFEGQHVYAMKISDNVDQDEDEPTFLLDSQIHAREVMTSEITCDAIDYLTSNYGSDPAVTRWVDELEIWIVPMINPDGAAYVFSEDDFWRKNRHPDCAVDNNRNFAWTYRQCEGSSSDCSDETNHGSGPASEPETQAVTNLMHQIRPMYYLSYHSYGEYIIWPSGCANTEETDLFSLLAGQLNSLVENDSGQTGQWQIGNVIDVLAYQAPGGSDDEAYGATGALALVFEINQDFHPDYGGLRNLTVQRQRAAWQYMLNRTLDGPSLRGHTFDGASHVPVAANYQFVNHVFQSGQWPLESDAAGRFGRGVLPDSDHIVVFTANGYLPDSRILHVGQGPVDLDVPMTVGVNHAPVVSGGPDQTANEGDTVVLDASGSADPDGNVLFFRWTQSAGPPVVLRNLYTAQPRFFAPSVVTDTAFTFQVTASDGALDSVPDTVTISVRDVWNETKVFRSADTPIAIPDDKPVGIVSTIRVSENKPILKATVHLDISHSYVGDLVIDLTSPAGTRVVLHNRQDSSTPNIHTDFTPPEFVGEMAAGDWVLRIADFALGDEGTLNEWVLSFDLVGEPPCTIGPDCKLPNADVQNCVGGRCEIVSCRVGFADCNHQSFDGCEINTANDPANCGVCLKACALPNAPNQCVGSECVLGPCYAGFDDCNHDSQDGCEASVSSDPLNCGSCGKVCVTPQAVPACVAGGCAVGRCEGLFGNCDGLASNGCEQDVSADVANCGACARPCSLPHAVAGCGGGVCTVASCLDTWSDCDGNPANGCEADLRTSLMNCGRCSHNCQGLHATTSCQAGECTLGVCLSGFDNCNGDDSDGCEVELRLDPEHCGSCDNSCALPHSSAQCVNATCVLDECEQGFGDCNHVPGDGCETDIHVDPSHCGGCGQVCRLSHATSGCDDGGCTVLSCDNAFGDCNALAGDGCEMFLNDSLDHCGACTRSCRLPGASSDCRQGACVLQSCDPGMADCDGELENGCEANLLDDATNCGTCGKACAFPNALGICQNQVCGLGGCKPGFGDCNQNPNDGCEIPISSDPLNCGGCGITCPPGKECRGAECRDPCQDRDADGYLDQSCGGDDCDDGKKEAHPGGTEVCNGNDDDCDGLTDEDLKCSEGCSCGNGSGAGASLLLLGLFGLCLRCRNREAR